MPQDPVDESRGERRPALVVDTASKVRWQPDGHIRCRRLDVQEESCAGHGPALQIGAGQITARICVGNTHHFEFDGFRLAPDEHAHPMIDGLISCAIVGEDE